MRKTLTALMALTISSLWEYAYTSMPSEHNHGLFEENRFLNTLPRDLLPMILQNTKFSDLLHLRPVSKNTHKEVMIFLRKGRSLGHDMPMPSISREWRSLYIRSIANYHNFRSDMGVLISKAANDLIEKATASQEVTELSHFKKVIFISDNEELLIENLISNFTLSPEIVKLTIKSLNLISLSKNKILNKPFGSHDKSLYEYFLRSMEDFINIRSITLTLSQLESIQFSPKMRLDKISLHINRVPKNKQFWDFLNFNETKKVTLMGNPKDLLSLIRTGQFIDSIEVLKFYNPINLCELDKFYPINTIFPSLKTIQLHNFYYSNLIKSLPTHTKSISVDINSDSLIDDLVNIPETVEEFQIIQSFSPTETRNKEDVIRDTFKNLPHTLKEISAICLSLDTLDLELFFDSQMMDWVEKDAHFNGRLERLNLALIESQLPRFYTLFETDQLPPKLNQLNLAGVNSAFTKYNWELFPEQWKFDEDYGGAFLIKVEQ